VWVMHQPLAACSGARAAISAARAQCPRWANERRDLPHSRGRASFFLRLTVSPQRWRWTSRLPRNRDKSASDLARGENGNRSTTPRSVAIWQLPISCRRVPFRALAASSKGEVFLVHHAERWGKSSW